MAEPLKDRYNEHFYQQLVVILKKVLPSFDGKSYMKSIFCEEWPKMELKARMWHTAESLHPHFPKNFLKAAELLERIIDIIKDGDMKGQELEYMFLPHYVEVYGMEYFEEAFKAFEKITTYTSCEFAIRPFIIRYPKKSMKQMVKWTKHKSHDVRRLASEGSRSRLPWAIALPDFKKDPSAVIPILEKLKDDESEYVRRSVANSLNDISKDNPDVVITICRKWKGQSSNLDALLKHGSRTLLKAGNPEVMKIFGFDSSGISIEHFKVVTPEVIIGNDLVFSVDIKNETKQDKMVRIEYVIYYLRKKGDYGKKVFKISERIIKANDEMSLLKSQSFRVITTKKFYRGDQKVGIVCNGNELAILPFLLT